MCRCLFTVGILSGLLTKELQALQEAQAWFSPFLEMLVAAVHFQKYSFLEVGLKKIALMLAGNQCLHFT